MPAFTHHYAGPGDHWEVRDAAGNVVCTTTAEPEAEAIADAMWSKAINRNVVSLLQEETAQHKMRAMTMEAALRLIHAHVMGDIVSQESGALRSWLADWIVGFQNEAVTHGPAGGPMLWPNSRAMPSVDKQLRVWGFEPTDGSIAYVRLRTEPKPGEKVQ